MKTVREYAHNGLAGCVSQRRSRVTGTLVGIYCNEQSGMESDPETPWSVVCEVHHTLVCVETLYAAQRTNDPSDFCEDCQDILAGKPPRLDGCL